jgi:hypothetical protein
VYKTKRGEWRQRGRGKGGEVTQTMYTHMNKYKNNKKKQNLFKRPTARSKCVDIVTLIG